LQDIVDLAQPTLPVTIVPVVERRHAGVADDDQPLLLREM
jgi:hypothetical protein